MNYLNSQEHKEHLERIRQMDKNLAELDKRIEQSRSEMEWVLKHRFKIWLGLIAFWSLLVWWIKS